MTAALPLSRQPQIRSLRRQKQWAPIGKKTSRGLNDT